MEAVSNKKRALLYASLYAALLLLVLLIANVEGFNRILKQALFYLRPVIIGLSIAYLSNPFFRLYELKLLYGIKQAGLRRFIALCMTYLTLLLILAVLLLLIVPQLITSIVEFVENADVLIDSAVNDVNVWIARINAGARSCGTTYSRMINGLKIAGIESNRKVLADLAITDAAAFTELCNIAKAARNEK